MTHTAHKETEYGDLPFRSRCSSCGPDASPARARSQNRSGRPVLTASEFGQRAPAATRRRRE